MGNVRRLDEAEIALGDPTRTICPVCKADCEARQILSWHGEFFDAYQFECGGGCGIYRATGARAYRTHEEPTPELVETMRRHIEENRDLIPEQAVPWLY